MNLVVFDIDGTLIQYHRKRNDGAYIKALEEIFGVVVEDSWSGYASSTDSGILGEIFQKHLGRDVSKVDIFHFKRSMALWLEKEYGAEPFEATPGATKVLNTLSEHSQWKMAVGTGNWEFAGHFKLASAGFNLGNIPIGSADDDDSREKVLEASHRKACRHHGSERFEKVVYVGDWVWDVKAAKALGWGFIGIGAGETEQALRKAGADVVLPDFNGLISKLEAI